MQMEGQATFPPRARSGLWSACVVAGPSGVRARTMAAIEARSANFCKGAGLYARSALLQAPQQRFELALLAPDVESHDARAVEQRDAEHHRGDRLALAPFLAQERLRPRSQVPEVAEAERRGQVGQRAGARRRG